jgi:hypothetical protein
VAEYNSAVLSIICDAEYIRVGLQELIFSVDLGVFLFVRVDAFGGISIVMGGIDLVVNIWLRAKCEMPISPSFKPSILAINQLTEGKK